MEALKLIERSPILRRMIYTALAIAFAYVVARALPGVAELIKVLHG
ncbi:TPA: hypothetical protein N3A08_003486 [Salmonella enterica subsp. salamae serovar 9,46:z4,z24:z39:z42]|nr:hypothetical protein [Salmonella enterica subsp. salamae serovar 9,46:z4,z24:z39:z42]